MDITEDTIPELQPIFSFLNSHSNKLYQEGYFLKLDDQNTRMLNPDLTAVCPLSTRLPTPGAKATPQSALTCVTRMSS